MPTEQLRRGAPATRVWSASRWPSSSGERPPDGLVAVPTRAPAIHVGAASVLVKESQYPPLDGREVWKPVPLGVPYGCGVVASDVGASTPATNSLYPPLRTQ
jgi:hypothetical protein